MALRIKGAFGKFEGALKTGNVVVPPPAYPPWYGLMTTVPDTKSANEFGYNVEALAFDSTHYYKINKTGTNGGRDVAKHTSRNPNPNDTDSVEWTARINSGIYHSSIEVVGTELYELRTNSGVLDRVLISNGAKPTPAISLGSVTNGYGITYDGTDLICLQQNGTVSRHQSDGTFISSFQIADCQGRDITWTGFDLYVVGIDTSDSNHKVWKIPNGGTSADSPVDFVPANNDINTTIAFDGTNLVIGAGTSTYIMPGVLPYSGSETNYTGPF